MPPSQLQSWLISQGDGKTLDSSLAMMPHDIYVIGTQESTLNERDWLNRLKSEISSINHYGMKKEFETVSIAMSSSPLYKVKPSMCKYQT